MQLSIFNLGCEKPYKIKKPIRLIELFGGIGSQAKALENLQANFIHYRLCEFDKYAVQSYNAVHGTNFATSDITKITADDLGIVDTDKYEYIMTYSFPCQDLSIAGKQAGMEKGSGTRSGLLWEVERLLEECEELPQILLMENVPQVLNGDFGGWLEFLESKGYHNYYKCLNAKNYGIPQNRDRCFMVSVLGNYYYDFPKEIPLKLRLKEMLEKEVDEKYFISEKLLTYFCDMKNRNGYIRGLRFNPHDKDKSKYAWTITTNAGNRPTDNFVIEPPVVGAFRGRKDSENDAYKQKLEINEEGVSNTLTSVQKDNVVLVPQATKKGYAVAHVGDGIYTNRAQSKRGVVQKNAIPTLKTSPHDLAVVGDDPEEMISIRRLTPRECWRLMGWKDKDIDRAFSTGVSDTQLYKQAGNSIVVNVLEEIFKKLF